MSNMVAMELTAPGLRLYAKIQTGRVPLEITRIAIGTGYLGNGESVAELTALKNEIPATTRILRNEIIGDGQTKLSFRMTGDGEDFELREIGVMANDPDEGEILYCACNYGDRADYVMTYAGSAPVTQEADIYFAIGAGKLRIEFAEETAAVTYKDFEKHTSDVSNPHNVTAAQIFPDNSETLKKITSQKKKDYDDAVLASHTHGNKSVLDGITNAFVAACNKAISHISSKSNPHGVTKSQVGLGNVTNESKTTMFTSPELTGEPTAPTPTSTDNSKRIATTAFVQGLITAIKNTLNSVASASHTHSNKSVLDGITNVLITAWNAAANHTSNSANPHGVTKSQIGLGNVTNESKTTMFTSPEFTGVPKAPTPISTDRSTRIANTAFVQNLIQNLEKKVNAIADAMIDGTYLDLLINIDNYGVCSNLDGSNYRISYAQYNSGNTHTEITSVASGVSLPKNTNSPVFLVSWASMSGDNSEIYNVQSLLYSNGEIYARHRYLWFIQDGVQSNPQWSEWSMEDTHIWQSKDPFKLYK